MRESCLVVFAQRFFRVFRKFEEKSFKNSPVKYCCKDIFRGQAKKRNRWKPKQQASSGAFKLP